MSDWEGADSEAEERSLPIRACPDCGLQVDIILESSDGVRFAAHSRSLEQYSEGFPPSAFVSGDTSVVTLKESSEVVPLLLQYMHLQPQPDISKLTFRVLEPLANAVEKYLIHSAIPICKIYMTAQLKQHPVEVLSYAAKHRYDELANEAALLTIDYEFKAMKRNFEAGSLIPYFLLEYKEQWMVILRNLYAEEPASTMLHKGGLRECGVWKEFYWEVLKTVGSSPEKLKQFDAVVDDASDNLEGCLQCINRARKWSQTIGGRVQTILPFSTFIS